MKKLKNISNTVPYTRSIPEIIGTPYLYDHEMLLTAEHIKPMQFVARVFDGTLMIGNDDVIHFHPLNNIDDFTAITEGNDEIRLSELLNQQLETENSTEIYLPLMRPGFLIYGHWLLDLLPKITIFKHLNPEQKYTVVIDDNCPKWVNDLIAEVAGSNVKIKRIAKEEVISGKFFITSPVRHHDFVSEMCKIDRPAITKATTRKIYLSREHLNYGYRQLKNRSRVEKIFKAKGFELIHPQELSIEEQVSIFSETAILAGEGGSALHNSVFCSEDTVIINLQSGRQNHFIQAGLCAWYNQQSIYVFGKTDNDEWGSSFKIRGKDCKAAIKKALSITS